MPSTQADWNAVALILLFAGGVTVVIWSRWRREYPTGTRREGAIHVAAYLIAAVLVSLFGAFVTGIIAPHLEPIKPAVASALRSLGL
jgi:peptidoglycan/LPS O-acetylase OafA/YrhL